MFERILYEVIQRRGAVILVTLILAVVGAFSLTRLPIDAVPDITNNQVVINTLCPGLAPEEVEKQVTFPLETALSGIPGLESTRSLSRNEFSQVSAVFSEASNIYFVRQLVSERLSTVRDRLPAEAEPSLGPISTGLGEVVMWVVELDAPDQPFKTPEGRLLGSPEERAAYLREIQEWVVRPQVRNVPGVADVDSIGGYSRQFVVEVDPDKLSALGIPMDTLVTELEKNNQNAGAGYIEVQGRALNVKALGRLHKESDIARVVIGERHGSPIRVSDVARVKSGRDLRMGSATQSGSEVVVGTAFMRIGENSRLVAQGVTEKLKEIESSLPRGVRTKVVLNRMQLVDSTISTVKKNLAEGAILVVVVLFAILGNLRAALIVATAIPLSMLFTAMGMVSLKMSGNLMSLGAIDFGLIVDGSVIIVENTVRVLAEREEEKGEPLTSKERLKAVYDASCSVRNATAFGEAIIILVYIPILFLTGVEGKMFRPMATTVILALASAFVLSLTFIPAMVAVGMPKRVVDKEPALLGYLRERYVWLLDLHLKFPAPTLLLSAVCLALGLWLFGRLGQEFVPTLDEKNLAMQAIRPPGTGVEHSTELQRKLEKLIEEFPQVDRVFSKSGTADLAADPMPPNISDTFIMLKPAGEWPDSSLEKSKLVEQIEEKVSLLPGHSFEFTQPIQMRFNELVSGVRGDVAVKVFGDDFAQLTEAAGKISKILEKVPGAQDVRVEQVSGLPSLSIIPNRDILGRLDLNVAGLQSEIATAIRGRESGFILEGDRRFPIVVRLSESRRADPSALGQLPIQLPRKAGPENEQNEQNFVPLSSLAEISLEDATNQVSRENGKRRVVVQCNVRGRDLGGFVEEAQRAVAADYQSPPGTYLAWGGQYQNLKEAKERLMLVVPVCLMMILIFLYASFRSVKLALLVFVGVPLALPGGILALWLRSMPFSISAAVGFIALSGVAVLNGLVLVTFIEELRQEYPLRPAVSKGCSVRFRPILMTALVAALGFVPMALSSGTGAEVQRPVATVVIGGLATTTPLILFVLPSLYLLMLRGKREHSPDFTKEKPEV
ncbi:MAG: CusA/CzcA family heavy metal efflux RND transporter [Candidatus Eremiobacteraeota bacterium]|nr:CusA/CzcA family heavy metal efflux RND transporter [Candidatus Eremiobacteraeota bacterium]MCW5869400.1 CusA/CzcA family heavy metal efflux RND transporter [Candidatus Eremiobacteraeota bacterium]